MPSELYIDIETAAVIPGRGAAVAPVCKIVGTDRLIPIEAEAVDEEIHNAPKAHHDHERSDAVESEFARMFTVFAFEYEKAYNIHEEKEKRDRKDEGKKQIVYELHDKNNIAGDRFLISSVIIGCGEHGDAGE